MILTLDVGNTNMTCGVFDGDEIKATFRITTKIPRTSDEYGMMLCNLLEINGIHINEIEDVAVCSVVPDVMHSLENFCKKYCNKQPKVVGPGIKTGLNIKYE